MQAGVDAGNGSVAKNVIPPIATATFDIRISPHMEPEAMKKKIDGWCQECSLKDEEDIGGISWRYIGKGNNYKVHSTTSTDAKVNPMYQHYVDGVKLSGIEIEPSVFLAATDKSVLAGAGDQGARVQSNAQFRNSVARI